MFNGVKNWFGRIVASIRKRQEAQSISKDNSIQEEPLQDSFSFESETLSYDICENIEIEDEIKEIVTESPKQQPDCKIYVFPTIPRYQLKEVSPLTYEPTTSTEKKEIKVEKAADPGRQGGDYLRR